MFFHPRLAQDLAAERTADIRRDAMRRRTRASATEAGWSEADWTTGRARQAARRAGGSVAGSLPSLSAQPPFRADGAGDAGSMNLISRLWSGLRRLTRKVADVIAECNFAQRKVGELRMDTERYVLAPDHKVPETYADFLLRTAGLLRHEPTARERAQGRRQLR